MLTFYDKWLSEINEDGNVNTFLLSFLHSSDESMNVLLNGSEEETLTAAKIIMNIDIKTIIDLIDFKPDFTSKDIVQYSNYKSATEDVCICLNTKNHITFEELGLMLESRKSELALKKFGENHAKLAQEFSFVSIKRENHIYYVDIASMGKLSILLDKKEREELIKRLYLRNKFMQALICEAKKGYVYYSDLAGTILSPSTIERRRSNVKPLAEKCLQSTDLINNIGW